MSYSFIYRHLESGRDKFDGSKFWSFVAKIIVTINIIFVYLTSLLLSVRFIFG